IVLDMAGMERIVALEDGLLTVEAGARLIDIERQVAPQGWELRMYPSTKRSATIGGFVAGGSGGIGSITYGGLRERGNIAGALVAAHALVPWDDLLREHDGLEILRRPMAEAEGAADLTPVYEYTWNHTTLQVLKKDKTITYLQSLFPAGSDLALVEEMEATFGDEVQLHLEYIRAAGAVTCSGLQIVRFTTEARLYEIIRHHEERRILIANPH